MNNSVFAGESALLDFLNPHHHTTPLVELPIQLNPFFNDGVRVFLKLQTFLPLGNVKSISAWGMLNEGINDNFSEGGVTTLVENSSGNTAFSLAILGRAMGISNMRAWVSNEITKGKLQLLQLFGVQVVVNQEQICPNPNDKRSGIYKAQSEGKQDGWYNPDQYHNPANPNIHYELTGAQLWDQLLSIDKDYNFQIFCAGLGTTGTFIGISKYLKEQKSDFFSLGVVRSPNNPIPGPRTLHLLQQIGFDWRKYVDHLQEISSKQAYETSLQLIRAGLLVGPSSGMALCGLFSELQKLKADGTLTKKKGENKVISAVVLCPDGPHAYLDEYFKYCDPKLFSKIINSELLLEGGKEINGTKNNKWNLGCESAFNLLYSPESIASFSLEQNPKALILNQGTILVDLRTEEEFEHVHLPDSLCMPFDHLELEKFAPYKNKKIVLVCSYGKKSAYRAEILQEQGFDAFGISGGIAEWSDKKLPRILNLSCIL